MIHPESKGVKFMFILGNIQKSDKNFTFEILAISRSSKKKLA